MCANYSRFYCNVESRKSTWEVHGIIHRDRVMISDRPPKGPKVPSPNQRKERWQHTHSASEEDPHGLRVF